MGEVRVGNTKPTPVNEIRAVLRSTKADGEGFAHGEVSCGSCCGRDSNIIVEATASVYPSGLGRVEREHITGLYLPAQSRDSAYFLKRYNARAQKDGCANVPCSIPKGSP